MSTEPLPSWDLAGLCALRDAIASGRAGVWPDPATIGVAGLQFVVAAAKSGVPLPPDLLDSVALRARARAIGLTIPPSPPHSPPAADPAAPLPQAKD